MEQRFCKTVPPLLPGIITVEGGGALWVIDRLWRMIGNSFFELLDAWFSPDKVVKSNYPNVYDIFRGECQNWHVDKLPEGRLDPMINVMTVGKFKLKCRVEIRSPFELFDDICDPIIDLQECWEIKDCDKEFSVPWILTNSFLRKLDYENSRAIHTLAHKAGTSTNAQNFLVWYWLRGEQRDGLHLDHPGHLMTLTGLVAVKKWLWIV